METIIHIATDDKFINNAYWQFEKVYPRQNKFYLLVDDCEKPLQYVKKEMGMHLIKNQVSSLKKLSENFGEASLICFHGLDYYSSIVLNNTPPNYKIVWLLWGFEIHNNPYLSANDQVLGPLSKEHFLLNKKERLKNTFKDIFKSSLYRIKNNTLSYYGEIAKAVQKADYCGVLYKEEFDLIKKKTGTNIKHFTYSYYPIEKMVRDMESRVYGNHILLGNSATPTNNHLEAFEILHRFDLGDRKVITPLSYGDPKYKKEILKKGKEILAHNFSPLTDFMPLHEYNTYLEQCGIVIMNHYRQQAVGNVLTLLWMGAKVFLDQRNTLYHYLKRLGIHIYSISEDLLPKQNESLVPLTEELRNENREILKSQINQKVLLEQLKNELGSIL